MPDLFQSLHQADYGHLKILADKWNLTLEAPDARQARVELVELILDRKVFLAGLEALQGQARETLIRLEEEGGRIRWFRFVREFGKIREMGAGRRERDHPEEAPVSPAEELWYRGLIARGFFDTDTGPQEFVYLPEDLRPLIREALLPEGSSRAASAAPVLGRKATPEERRSPVEATDWILDHSCTLLAARRIKSDPGIQMMSAGDRERSFLLRMLEEAGLLQDQEPDPDKLRAYLELSREEALLVLWETWKESRTYSDLERTPGLILEGEQRDDPFRTRTRFLNWIEDLPPDTWWSISALTAAIKGSNPDFLRVSGDYQSWFIRSEESGQYLRGFEHWDEVEGAVIHHLISGPGHWLGVFDLAFPEEPEASRAAAFRLSPWAAALLNGQQPSLPEHEQDLIQVRSRGTLTLSRYVDWKVRYQVSRFSEWLEPKQNEYIYRITPESLDRARDQGLEVDHLLVLLENHAEAVPPNLVTALRRWSDQGVEAQIGRQIVLRVSSPAVLDALQQSKAKRYLKAQLGPTTVVLQEGGEAYVNDVLVEMGFLVNREGEP
jgi:hypothetical protein